MPELTDIAVEIRHETDNALLVWAGVEDGFGDPIEIWLPKSQVEVNEDGTITLPEWLAIEKGLI